MRLRCEFSTLVARCDVDDYIRHLVISIECFGKDYDSYVVGKLAMDQILWNDALADGVPLFDICDNDSQGLHEALCWFSLKWKFARFELAGKGWHPLKRSGDCTGA